MTLFLGDLLAGPVEDIERVLADVEGIHLQATPVEFIADLWNPATCRADLLPYLAWALSVDVWNENWSVETQRAVIAASVRVHRHKGTRAAVEDAVGALGLIARFTEWWESTPPRRRGTFQVMVLATESADAGVVVTEELQRDVVRMVRAAKPKSRVAEIGVGVQMAGDLGALVGAGAVVSFVRLYAGEIFHAAGLVGGAGVVGFVRITAGAEA